MDKFEVKKDSGSSNKTIRMPNDTIDKIEAYIKKHDCTFTDFMLSAVDFALENKKD